MRKVAVFGNAGGGKSTLARHLAEITGLPLYSIDRMQFRDGGAPVSQEEYLKWHRQLLAKETWIIDGYGDTATVWERCELADTLIHIDLPLPLHYWWVTKRLIKGLFADPEGWPKDSPLWSSTMSSYRVLLRCHRHLTPWYRQLVSQMLGSKRVVHLRSAREIAAFLNNIQEEFRAG